MVCAVSMETGLLWPSFLCAGPLALVASKGSCVELIGSVAQF